MMDLQKLNSLTKYPSIPTYHTLDKGKAKGDPLYFPEGSVIGTEKIDGVNARVIVLPYKSHVFGSREELLYHSGDILHNPALGIVDALRPVPGKVDKITYDLARDTAIVFYLEVYGGNVTAASKNYTSKKEVAYRLFDVAVIREFSSHMERTVEQIANWRDNGGQRFYNEVYLREASAACDLPLTPRLFDIRWDELPHTVEATKSFLSTALPWTQAHLDDNASKIPEGIVLRTPDRSVIAKMKFRDYR